jgi:hypothetical protein
MIVVLRNTRSADARAGVVVQVRSGTYMILKQGLLGRGGALNCWKLPPSSISSSKSTVLEILVLGALSQVIC